MVLRCFGSVIMAKAPAVVLSSGGLHSLVCAGVASREYRVALLHIKDGRVTGDQALAAFERQAAAYKPLKTWILDASHLPAMRLPPETAGVSTSTGSDAHAALVPLRELQYLTIAAGFAKQIKASTVFWGVQHDAKAGEAVVKTIELVQLVNQTLELLGEPGGEGLHVRTPLLGLEDGQVVELGYQIGAPFAASWTCQTPLSSPCMSCPACTRRVRAFRAAGLADPLVNASKVMGKA